MNTKFKISIFAALFLCSTAIMAQDAIMQGINNALVSGDCTKASKLYEAWKAANRKTNSGIESLISDCKKGAIMQGINDALASGDCTKASKLYEAWKEANGKTNSGIESLISDCKSGSKGVSNTPSASAGSNQTFTVNGVSFTMVYVQGGTFTMGCTSEQGSDCHTQEKPAHNVTLSSYYMGKFEVTQALWKAVMGSNPSNFKGDNLPVENVSWEDCKDFIISLNAKTSGNFRLPTEAEWEYAARGGNRRDDTKYSGGYNMNNVGWYADNSGSTTHTVGTKSPNGLGIYDMSGNVWEWCNDCWSDSYSSSSQTNPQGASSGPGRVLRGGGWYDDARSCRVSNNYNFHAPAYRYNFSGFRLAFSSK